MYIDPNPHSFIDTQAKPFCQETCCKIRRGCAIRIEMDDDEFVAGTINES